MTSKTIHRLNREGIEKFIDFIEATRKNEVSFQSSLSLDPLIIEDPRYSEKVSDEVIDDKKKFRNRYDLGHYLVGQWTSFSDEFDYKKPGVWEWFAAVYFDQLRNKQKQTRKNGEWSPITQADHHFIVHKNIKSEKSRTSLDYRHSIRMPFQLIKNNYQDEFIKLCFFRDSAEFFGDAAENFCSNGKLLTSPALIRLMVDLYYDESTQQMKSGASSKITKKRNSKVGYGGISRVLKTIIPRVKKTWDVEEMTPSELIKVSGRELLASKWV